MKKRYLVAGHSFLFDIEDNSPMWSNIGRALYKGADVLFFDEATSSLDSATEKEINDSILELSNRRKDLTIIAIAHRESSLLFCDRIIDLK